MTLSASSPSDALRAGILAEARRQAEDILRCARQEADKILAKADADAQEEKFQRLEAARALAAARRERILARIPMAERRLRAGRVAAVLQSIHDAARQRLLDRQGFDHREAVVTLSAQAVGRMEGESFVVRLPAADCLALGNPLADDIARRGGRPGIHVLVSPDSGQTDGGPVIQGAEGRQVWDNRFLVRLERMWPELRRQMAPHVALDTARGDAEAGA